MALRSTLCAEYASYKPIGGRVLIRKIKESKEAGGLTLPDNFTRSNLAEAEIVSVGPAVEHFKAGDRVLLHRQLSFNKINLGGEDLEIVPHQQLVAVVERS